MGKKKGLLYLFVLASALAIVSSSCGVSAVSNFFATATSTPTLTFTPTLTSTPSPTSTSTPTPTPTSTPLPTGIATEQLANGSTLFIDYDNRYQMTLPEDWVIIPVAKEDLEEVGQNDPEIAKAAEAFKNLDPDVLRMAALNRKTEFLKGGYASNITVTAIEEPIFSVMPLSFITGALEESFTQQGIQVLTTGENAIENANGVEVEYIDVEQKLAGVQVLQRIVVFQSNQKLMLVTISTTPQFRDEIFQVAEDVGGSLVLIK
jgi:hypothetical protein